jgi:hypothetical protein
MRIDRISSSDTSNESAGVGGRLRRGPLAAGALVVAFLGGVGAAIVAGAGAPAPGSGPRLVDSLNALVSTLTFVALLWGLHFHRQEVRLKLREEQHRLESLRQTVDDIRRQSRMQSRQAALLAASTYMQSRQEARASFAKSRSSSRASDRLLRLNRFCSKVVDEILEEAGAEPLASEDEADRPEEEEGDERKVS